MEHEFGFENVLIALFTLYNTLKVSSNRLGINQIFLMYSIFGNFIFNSILVTVTKIDRFSNLSLMSAFTRISFN